MLSIFKGFFKKPAAVHTASADLGFLKVEDAYTLLAPHAALLSQIKTLAGLSDAVYGSLYEPVLKSVARLSQQLPVTALKSNQDEPKTLLGYSLKIGLLAMRLRQSYLLSSEEGAEAIAKKQDLWTYAVFSGVICRLVGESLFTIDVELKSPLSTKTGHWNPLSGFMDAQGSGYRYKAIKQEAKPLPPRALLVIAYKLFPELGLSWLSREPVIFSQWLLLISGDLENAGALGEILNRALHYEIYGSDALAVKAELKPSTQPESKKAFPEYSLPDEISADSPEPLAAVPEPTSANTNINHLAGSDPSDEESPQDFEVIDNPFGLSKTSIAKPDISPVLKTPDFKQTPSSEPLAASFLSWLQQGIKSHTLSVNEAGAPIQVVSEGVLLATPEIFKRYAKDHALEDWMPVQKLTLKQNWHLKVKGVNIMRYQVKGQHKVSVVNGLLIQNAAFIFGDLNIPKPNPHLHPLTLGLKHAL